MRSDSAEAVELMTGAVAPAHFITRLFSASGERIRNVLLDPALRAMWANSDTLAMAVPPALVEHGHLFLMEHVQGHPIDVSMRLNARAGGCEIHVELRLSATFDKSTLFDLGIDDLWETRLYAIADMLRPEPFTTIR